jgi:excinuclease UvrABC ATPase subunit
VKTFEGIVPNLERRWKETDSAWAREEIERYHVGRPLPGLRRLPPETRSAGGQDQQVAHRRSHRAVDPQGQ